jgi:hypothetical protein
VWGVGGGCLRLGSGGGEVRDVSVGLCALTPASFHEHLVCTKHNTNMYE